MKQVVNCARIQFLFPVHFEAHVYFQPTIHRSKNLVDFLTLSMPFCAFGAKGMGREKIRLRLYSIDTTFHKIAILVEISYELYFDTWKVIGRVVVADCNHVFFTILADGECKKSHFLA